MNQRRVFISLLCLFSFLSVFSQAGYLFIKKGFKKKRIYTEGDAIQVQLRDGNYNAGWITLLLNDTIYINGNPVPRMEISKVILPRKKKQQPPDAKTLLLIGAGSALFAAGLTLSKQADAKEAAVTGLVIGYGPLLIKHVAGGVYRTMLRKKFRIGKKFRLQVIDFHIKGYPLKSF
jgi:hypothetical protein